MLLLVKVFTVTFTTEKPTPSVTTALKQDTKTTYWIPIYAWRTVNFIPLARNDKAAASQWPYLFIRPSQTCLYRVKSPPPWAVERASFTVQITKTERTLTLVLLTLVATSGRLHTRQEKPDKK